MGKKFNVTLEILIDGKVPLSDSGDSMVNEFSLFKNINIIENEKMIRQEVLKYLHYFDPKGKIKNSVVSGNILISTKYKNQCLFAKYIRRNKKFVYEKNTTPYINILLA
jgi:hypothetical protein